MLSEETVRIMLQSTPGLDAVSGKIMQAAAILISAYRQGKKLLLCGNGGSLSDCEHIAGELLKGFLKKRPLSDQIKKQLEKLLPDDAELMLKNLQMPLRALTLNSHPSFTSAFANDISADFVFAQAALAHGDPGDVLLAISTSGNAKNVIYAAKTAKLLNLKVIGLSGETGGQLAAWADLMLCMPHTDTYRIQEMHVMVYHILCRLIEEAFFPV
ncbi:MAG: hypothetical protein A2096_10270 [Spirochaetes bacterium GWF1_41_5]|nr:MAG: hypothetical protein A2096_10270 [Spirochaetes bacterium GWF1_41_5]